VTDWKEDAYEAARRCWTRSRMETDTKTRKALERAGTRFFWRACGMEGGPSDPPSPGGLAGHTGSMKPPRRGPA